MGCGYALPDEYRSWETTCGACLNLQAMAIEKETT
jgi:hypothetical protein